MKKLIAVLAAAALLVTAAVPSVVAGTRYGHSGYYGHGGHYYNYRPYYRCGYGSHYKYRRHGYGRVGIHGDAAVVVGVLAGAVVLGALLSQPSPAPAYAPYPTSRQPALGNCLQTTGTGTWYGRPARFTGTRCYDPAGGAYVLPGSERFIGYLR